MRLLGKYPEIADAYRLGAKAKGVVTAGPMGAVLFLGTRAQGMEKRAQRFADAVSNGLDLTAGDPRHAVREAFINRRNSQPGARLPETTWCFVAISRAWNAFVTGQELERILVKRNQDGSWTIPDVLGGPPRGEGVDSLSNVKLSPAAKRARAQYEEEAGLGAQ